MWDNPLFFSFENTKYFNTHTRGEGGKFFKETYSDVYPKYSNSWIHNTDFKPLKLTLIFLIPLYF